MTLPEHIRDYVDTSDLIAGVSAVAGMVGADLENWSRARLENGQLKPEYLINLNAFGIICFQVLVSFIVRRMWPLASIILGVAMTTAVGLVIYNRIVSPNAKESS